MKRSLETYKVKDWIVLGCTSFKPPFQVSDALINEARIVHVVRGQSKIYSANKLIELKSGDTLIMKTDNFVNNWLPNQTDELNKVIVFQLSADFLKHLYSDKLPNWFKKHEESISNSIEKVVSNQLISSFFENIQLYFNESNYLDEDLTQIKTKELISLLINTDQIGSIKNIFNCLFEKKEYEFQEVIQDNLFEDLSIENLAFLTNHSLSSFKRKFSSIYGVSPNKYIVSKRLEKAQSLLNSDERSISQIAFDCGFSDVSYFSKTFKKYYNISPSDFKNQQLN